MKKDVHTARPGSQLRTIAERHREFGAGRQALENRDGFDGIALSGFAFWLASKWAEPSRVTTSTENATTMGHV
jgi:hypothetical protein